MSGRKTPDVVEKNLMEHKCGSILLLRKGDFLEILNVKLMHLSSETLNQCIRDTEEYN